MKSILLFLALTLIAPLRADSVFEAPEEGEHIALIGNGLGERLQYFGKFESQLHLRYPEHHLSVRNLCYSGDTPAYRPRAGRPTPWAFPGGEKFRPELNKHRGEGHYPSPDEWLTICKADTVLAFFGFNESFDGPGGVEKYRAELDAFVAHTLTQKYNGKSAPKLVLVSPIAFEDLSSTYDLPDGIRENTNLALYTDVMREVAKKRGVGFIDLFSKTKELYATSKTSYTINGFSLHEIGDQRVSYLIADSLYAPKTIELRANPAKVMERIKEKTWLWQNDHRMLNGVHAYGRRWKPFGDFNYPQEIEKLREMTAIRDQAIWKAVIDEELDLAAADEKTRTLDPVETNFPEPVEYLRPKKSLESFTMMDGFQIELFADERDFPDLANPVQMTFDSKGRLWVCTMPSYPHYRPGDPMPDDKILILEDTDGDHRADKQTIFADGLHLPIGIELAPGGVYVSQEPNLVFLSDITGDDKADNKTYLLHGFDSHDTHHAISAFSSDASGALYMAEGTFLHSQVETPYGPQRCTGGGIWRFDPKSFRLDRVVQTEFYNPWGIAFDDWDNCFIGDASDGNNWWELPLSAKAPFDYNTEKIAPFAPKRSRPTSGAEFVSSRHFPEEMQGAFMQNNTIGFLGTSVNRITEDDGGFSGELLGDLLSSSDPNFRPCDLEFAPDGSLYILDWHNALVGHMQHSARDPKRDHAHGRIYRVTHKDRPLVEAPQIAGASIPKLFTALTEPEYRTRYRARRELRSQDWEIVVPAAKAWIKTLDPTDDRYEHHLTEALWVTWSHNRIDPEILQLCLSAKSEKARAAAVRVIRHSWRRIPNHTELLTIAANDPNPQVRLEAIIAASWLDNPDGARIALEAFKHPIGKWMPEAIRTTFLTLADDVGSVRADGKLDLTDNPLAGEFLAGTLQVGNESTTPSVSEPDLSPEDLELWRLGKEVYSRDAHCATCHQATGLGMEKIYPPLAESEWVVGNEERLIKLVLNGVWGPITVNETTYDPANGVPPMTGFAPLLNDREIAGVLTYIRNHFGNRAPPIKPETISKIREETKEKKGFYSPEELLKLHPFTK